MQSKLYYFLLYYFNVNFKFSYKHYFSSFKLEYLHSVAAEKCWRYGVSNRILSCYFYIFCNGANATWMNLIHVAGIKLRAVWSTKRVRDYMPSRARARRCVTRGMQEWCGEGHQPCWCGFSFKPRFVLALWQPWTCPCRSGIINIAYFCF